MSTPISRLDSGAPDFIERLDALLAFDASTDDAIEMAVAGILRDVRKRGDDAVLDYTRRFDRLDAAAMVELELPRSVLDEAYA
ncbi:MAG: histidinol dehydrogenase, partial [Methyloversatilis sp.]|nr:histidinol dehydrogenase [Methyloversatilis sp.]